MMADTAIEVWLGEPGQRVGTLIFHEQGARCWSSFCHEPDWLACREAFSLSPDLPLSPGWRSAKAESSRDSAFHCAIEDTGPGGWAQRVIRRIHATHKQLAVDASNASPARTLNDLDLLLAVDDASRVGALRFCRPGGEFLGAASGARSDVPPFAELPSILAATRAVELGLETPVDLACLHGTATSLGGVRPKCSVLDEHGMLCIAKFSSTKDQRSIPRGEVLALALARKAGINAAKASIVMVRDTPVAMITRFDRVADGHGRILYLSAASLLQADSRAEHSYTEMADAIRRYSPDPAADLHELWRRIVFSMLIGNTDDHLRNHGFLYAGAGRWRLSPAFDINPDPNRSRALKTWLTEESGPTASITEAVNAAPHFDLNQDAALAILREVLDAVRAWRDVAGSRDVGMTVRDLAAFAPAFEHEGIDESQRLLGARRRSSPRPQT